MQSETFLSERGSDPRRRLLYASVCAMLYEHGYQSARNSVIETITELVQALICELGKSSRSLAEICGRTEPLFVDAFIAMVEMGLDTTQLVQFGLKSNKIVLPPPQVQSRQGTPKMLQAGERRSLCHYIPDHFPSFPDAHSYIRTPTYKQPVTEYEAIREKASSQKRDVERALTRFMAKTCEQSISHSLFPDEQSAHVFPLINLNLKSTNTYLSALLPRDQIFDDDEEQAQKKDEKREEEARKAAEDKEAEENEVATQETEGTQNRTDNENDIPDNPFLRPTKICRRRGGKI